MHPLESELLARLRAERLLVEADEVRRSLHAAPLPPVPFRLRVTALKQAVGYRLVEAGLRLVVTRPAVRGSPEAVRPPYW